MWSDPQVDRYTGLNPIGMRYWTSAYVGGVSDGVECRKNMGLEICEWCLLLLLKSIQSCGRLNNREGDRSDVHIPKASQTKDKASATVIKGD